MTTRQRIERLVRQWRTILGLDSWHIETRFDEKKYLGTCRAQPEYEEATIAFNLPQIGREIKTVGRLEDLVVHELVHCLTWGERKKPVDELLTTRVHRALLRARATKVRSALLKTRAA